ncbi:MAG: hypothetical protein WC314_13405 [Vulcanimicrobiota bacterium]
MTRPDRRRGFALISTIGALTLALLLLSAFLQSNRSFFTLTRMDDDRQACHEALLSLSEYLRFKFEEDRGWGQGEWSGKEIVQLSGTRVLFSLDKIEGGTPAKGHGLVGHRHLIGEGKAHNVEIHVAFSNNITKDTNSEFRVFGGSSNTENVQAKMCLLRISARRGSYTEQAEIALRRAAFFDSTLAASGNITIDVNRHRDGSDSVVFNSKDPFRNQIRSDGDIDLPPSRYLDFRKGEENPPPTQGTIWSKERVLFDGENDTETLSRAVRNLDIEIVDHAKNHYNVPELLADDIEVGDSEGATVHLTPKRYVFTQAQVTYDQPDGTENSLQMRILKEINPDTNVVERFHYNGQDINEEAGTVRISYIQESEQGVVPDDLRGIPHGYDEFTVDNGKIHVQLRGEDFVDTGVDARRESRPRLILPKTSRVGGSFQVEADDYNLVPTISFGANENKGYLSAEGQIDLEGHIKGGGKIISREDTVRLRPNQVRVLTDQQTELAVFAKKNVIIIPPHNEMADDETDQEGQRGADVFRFRGLIYAGQDFKFETREGFNRKLSVEGAVVARNGSINIQSQAGVELTYNPKYLDDFLEKSTLDRKVQVEELSWRPI